MESAGLFGESDLLSSRPSDVAGGVFDKGDKSKRPVEDDTDKQRLSTAFGLSEASPFDMEVESDVSGEFSKDLGPDATVIKQPDLSVFSESGIEFGRGNKDKGSLPEPTQKTARAHCRLARSTLNHLHVRSPAKAFVRHRSFETNRVGGLAFLLALAAKR